MLLGGGASNLREPLLSPQPINMETIKIPRQPSKLPSVITYDEYKDFRELTADHTNLPESILEKLNYAKKYYKQQPSHGYSIQKEDFDTVYSTSDIHSDVYTFIKILQNLGLITRTREDAGPISIEEIFKLRWNAMVRRTLLVIVGDLVDGARSTSTRLDGDVEILLHILIYNLRISARNANSEIRFTLGNHDFHTVIQQEDIKFPQTNGRDDDTIYGPGTINEDDKLEVYFTNPPKFYNNYVAQAVKDFFTGQNGVYDFQENKRKRRNCLILFYECSPYICLKIEYDVIFIHGSLHSKAYDEPVDLTQSINEIQDAIDNSIINFGDLGTSNAYSQFLGIMSGSQISFGSPLWSRIYAYSTEEETCSIMEKSPYKLIVVGHCPTNTDTIYKEEDITLFKKLLDERKADKCRTIGGCVLLGCENKIAFVDISMSTTENQSQGKNRGEVLKLIKNNKNNFIPTILSAKENLTARVGNTPQNFYPGYNVPKPEDEDDEEIKPPPRPTGEIPSPVGEIPPYNLQGGGKRKQRRKKTLKKKKIYRKKYTLKKSFLK